jgi:hypothetical protein
MWPNADDRIGSVRVKLGDLTSRQNLTLNPPLNGSILVRSAEFCDVTESVEDNSAIKVIGVAFISAFSLPTFII